MIDNESPTGSPEWTPNHDQKRVEFAGTNGAGIGRKWLSAPVIPDRMTVEISHEPTEPGVEIMCITDVGTESDGKYVAFCYCGWSTEKLATEAEAESLARQHQQNSDARQPQGYPWDED